MSNRHCLLLVLVTVAAAFTAATATAGEYPERPVRFIVPQAAGSSSDTVARILSASLAPELGQQIVIDNRPGGALTIGMEATAKAPPDGYTIGLAPIGAMAINRSLVAKLPYDPDRDFQPVAVITYGHLMLAVYPGLPVNSVAALIEYARQNPGKLMNASSSNGSPGHVGGELFKQMTGTSIVHVPYKGGAQAINDLIAGHVQLMFESLNTISTFARSGKVRALGVSGPHRSPAFPDVPTIAEAGVTGYEVRTWSGVVVPAGVPRAIVDRLNAAINRAIASPQFRDRYTLIGDEPGGGTPEQFAALIKSESARWAEVVRRSGARID